MSIKILTDQPTNFDTRSLAGWERETGVLREAVEQIVSRQFAVLHNEAAAFMFIEPPGDAVNKHGEVRACSRVVAFGTSGGADAETLVDLDSTLRLNAALHHAHATAVTLPAMRVRRDERGDFVYERERTLVCEHALAPAEFWTLRQGVWQLGISTIVPTGGMFVGAVQLTHVEGGA